MCASRVTKATIASVAVTTVTMVTDVVIDVAVAVTRNVTSSLELVQATVHRAGLVTTAASVCRCVHVICCENLSDSSVFSGFFGLKGSF